jgi:hypothetical protein
MKRLLLLPLALAGACSDQTVDLGGDYFVSSVVPPIENHDVDVLFVVDNSQSMMAHRAEIATRVQSSLTDVLAATLGGEPNLHIGVITSDMGTNGAVTGDTQCADSDEGHLQTGSCAGGPVYLEDIEGPDGTRIVNYEGALEDALACMVDLGNGGCGFEQPFAAVQASVTNPANAGFLRTDALLVVIFLTDEDDCSASGPELYSPTDMSLGPVDSYRCFAQSVVCDQPLTEPGIKTNCEAREDSPLMASLEDFADALIAAKGGDATKIMVSAISGPNEPIEVGQRTPMGGTEPRLDLIASCAYTTGDGLLSEADPSFRMGWLMERFAGLSWAESVCDPVADTLARTANVVGDVAARHTCLRGALRDTDEEAAGVQPTCRVAFATNARTANEVRRDVVACEDDGDTGCFAVAADATCAASGLSIELRGAAPAAGESIITECLRAE